MSIPTGIDSDAPVRAHHEIDINAPLDTVWRLHAASANQRLMPIMMRGRVDAADPRE